MELLIHVAEIKVLDVGDLVKVFWDTMNPSTGIVMKLDKDKYAIRGLDGEESLMSSNSLESLHEKVKGYKHNIYKKSNYKLVLLAKGE